MDSEKRREFEVSSGRDYSEIFWRYTVLLTTITVGHAVYFRILDFGENKSAAFQNRVTGGIIIMFALMHWLFAWYAVARQKFPLLPVWLYFYLHTAMYVQYYSFVRGYLRGIVWRVFITWPSSWYSGLLMFQFGAFLTIHKLFPRIFTMKRITGILVILMTISIYTSLIGSRENLTIELGNTRGKDLKVIQISDIHFGPMMSVERARTYVEHVVSENPDLVLITGDMFTMESHNEVSALSTAFEPLKQLKGKVFACLGNHDHEVPFVVSELERIGARVLIDQKVDIETRAGKITIIGMDYVHMWKAEEHFAKNRHLFSPNDSEYRFVMIHHPKYFENVPIDDKTNLIFSGHHHGGQVSLGYGGWTVLTLVSLPDHSMWCKNAKSKIIRVSDKCFNNDRLYVHRGTGFYGLPLRVGVPNEESVFNIKL